MGLLLAVLGLVTDVAILLLKIGVDSPSEQHRLRAVEGYCLKEHEDAGPKEEAQDSDIKQQMSQTVLL